MMKGCLSAKLSIIFLARFPKPINSPINTVPLTSQPTNMKKHSGTSTLIAHSDITDVESQHGYDNVEYNYGIDKKCVKIGYF